MRRTSLGGTDGGLWVECYYLLIDNDNGQLQ